jgi:hypothetical protein
VIKLLSIFLVSFSVVAGVGDITGGAQRGDKIHFEKDSTWVNSYYSKSLCFDGENFHAKIHKCVKWVNRRGGEECAKTEKFAAIQPQYSTRKRCVKQQGRSGNCKEWENVDYFQSEIRIIDFYRERGGGRAYKTETIVIPTCI